MPLSKKIYALLFLISIGLTLNIAVSSASAKKERLISVINLHVERINAQMAYAVHVTEILKEITKNSEGVLGEEEFNTLAHAVGEGLDYITIQYMPEGIVKYAYPLEGNEATIGHNVLTSEATSLESYIAMEENTFVVSGPFLLLQGMQGLAIRNPLFIDEGDTNAFWGFITIVLPVPDVLKDTGVFELENLGYEFRLTARYKDADMIFFETQHYSEQFAESMPIHIGDTQWSLSMYVKKDRQDICIQSLLFFAAFILCSTIIYGAIQRVEYRLERDPLSGAYNRRVLESFIKPRDLAKEKKFVVLYIDLNDFKPVNDTFGHETGDRLLIAYVKRLQSNIKSDGLIYRIGGDEFVVIIPGLIKTEAIKAMIKRINHISKDIFIIHGHTISVSASIGYSIFPLEGKDIKALLEIADERMYTDKQAQKKARIQ